MSRYARTLTLCLALLASTAATADAAKRFTIRGAGFGHGVGMSQYGAMGYAQHGWTYRAILGHYYTDTRIGVLDAPRTVRVLMRSAPGTASFSGASRAAGRRVSPGRTYSARGRAGGQVDLLAPGGRVLATVPGPLRATGPGPLTLHGRAGNGRTDGAYRGALEFRPGVLGGIDAVNAVDLEDYVRGVVPLESPASWPIEALKAQAVAARTYAVTTSKGGAGFDHYPDTRSQVYGGAAVETPTTDSATQATAGQLVTYAGRPVATYFFSTSGGRTEDVENTTLGDAPVPWLKSVEDRYDDVSPRHRWGPIRMTHRRAARALGELVKGRFRGIQVVRRGRSPRIVAADVVGSRGRTRVDGATLRARFGLYDSWAYFTSITTRESPPPADPVTGGTGPIVARAPVVAGLAGRVIAACGSGEGRRPCARVRMERRVGGRWIAAGTAAVRGDGRYRAGLTAPGTYRVRHGRDAGPPVRVG